MLFWQVSAAWVCPPSAAGNEHTPAEVQRIRISRALIPVLGVTFCAILILNNSPAHVLAIDVPHAGLEILGMGVACLTLSHYRRARLAGWAYILAFCAFSLSLLFRQDQALTWGQMTLLIYGPILVATAIFETWVGWGVAAFLLGALVTRAIVMPHAFALTWQIVLVNGVTVVIGTGMIALFMHGFHRALHDADRSQEIAYLNDELHLTLAESEKVLGEFSTVFETVQDGLIVLDTTGREAHRNAAVVRILGDIPQGQTIADILNIIQVATLDGMAVPPQQMAIMRVLRGEEPDPPTPYRFRRSDGVRFIGLLTTAALTDVCGERIGALAVVRDITSAYHNERRIEIMREVAHACASAPGEQAVAQAAVEALMAGLDIPTGFLLIRDPERPQYARILYCHLSQGISPEQFAQIQQVVESHPIDDDAPLLVLRTMVTGETAFAYLPVEQVYAPKPFGPAHYVPLRFGGEIMGILGFLYDAEQPVHWETHDSDLLLTAADEIATSLHRARLYEEARRLALFDPLTGLRNQRALRQALQQEFAAAAEQARPLAVIMLDVDHFRRFNELYGHDVGDRALQTVAAAIQSVIRHTDYGARYGGEEFTVILPETDSHQAQGIAERIRAAIAAHTITVGAGQPVSISASIGYATYPAHASDPAELLKAADIALYAAKHQGRNRVVGYADGGEMVPPQPLPTAVERDFRQSA